MRAYTLGEVEGGGAFIGPDADDRLLDRIEYAVNGDARSVTGGYEIISWDPGISNVDIQGRILEIIAKGDSSVSLLERPLQARPNHS